MKKLLAVAIMILFISVSVIPSTGTTDVKQSTICNSNNPPYVPSNPIPPNGSTNVFPCLEWTGGDPDGDIVVYNVYCGKTTPPQQIVANISQTMWCPSFNWELNTTYYWKIVAWDEHGASTEGPIWWFTTIKYILPGPPYGPTKGLVGVEYTFYFDLPDNPDCEPYYLIWDWGDGYSSDWLGPYGAGETVCANHSWAEPGEYDIRVIIRDDCGNTYWSDPWTITILNITKLDIEIQVKIPGKMIAIIRNIGNETAYDVYYSINVKVKGIIIGLNNMYQNGTVNILPPDSERILTISKWMLIGLGWIKVNVTASAFNADEVSKELNAFVFLFFIMRGKSW